MNRPPTSGPPPEAPRLKSTGLPNDEPQAQLPSQNHPGVSGPPTDFMGGHPILPEDMDIRDLPSNQLYEMNQNLMAESVSTRPLIDQLTPMEVLRAEYENGSRTFVSQIDYLMNKGYRHIWRARGDGDCFYRSLAYAFVLNMLDAPQAEREIVVATALSQLQSCKPMLSQAGFEPIAYDMFYEAFEAVIQSVVSATEEYGLLTSDSLLRIFQDANNSNEIVAFLRLLTSAQIRLNPDEYAAFIIDMEPTQFCNNHVEPLGKEADHIQVSALADAMQIRVQIAYLDGHKANEVDFIDVGNKNSKEPLLLLYRPGHYDILSRKVM
ncbi:cysteine proteinase [Coniophora puteana RWD-64-598 SS2]|uniref:ubiquitinyl hydrolase 1 n=1 Tax=Coniophora puteana (strain RWD-64-598) TaxID=741705 RepID=A0A5M3MDI9_CONPW|nr:cysteine proteinase [Coniophora puteana RWD-64-598 SS2]EIW76685.1 cysteine proteinase [Coniophora puteana RWD-64-598 SS2]